MKSYLKNFFNAANYSIIENATSKDCILANMFQILCYKTNDISYIEQLSKITQNPHEEYENFMEGDNIVKIIACYKIILKNRGKYYLTNTWGINADELTNDIEKFELDFKNFFNNLEENVRKGLEDLIKEINITNYVSYNENEHKDYSIVLLYAYNNLIGALDKEIAFTSLYISHIEKYKELKHKIYNAATKNSYEYIAELRANANQDPDNKHLPLEVYIFITMLINHLYANTKSRKYDIELNELKRIYKKFTATKEISVLNVFMDNISTLKFDPFNDNFSSLIEEPNSIYSFIYFLSNNNIKYAYLIYHWGLSKSIDINEFKSIHLKCGVGRLLYDGYNNWCKKNKIKPLIEFSRSQLIEYPSNANDTQYHFPKKRFIDHSNNVKREKLNKTFLKNLLKGMIDEKIIASDTKEEHFFFVFGWGEDNIKDFKAIEILKPNTNYIRENGKRTIIFLLTRLMKYREDEDIKPKFLYRKRHLILIINSCFKASTKFKSSDFGEKTTFEGSEILKMQNIYNTALNATRETIQ